MHPRWGCRAEQCCRGAREYPPRCFFKISRAAARGEDLTSGQVGGASPKLSPLPSLQLPHVQQGGMHGGMHGMPTPAQSAAAAMAHAEAFRVGGGPSAMVRGLPSVPRAVLCYLSWWKSVGSRPLFPLSWSPGWSKGHGSQRIPSEHPAAASLPDGWPTLKPSSAA